MGAIIAAVIGLCGVSIGAFIARQTAMSIAELNAEQKRRDVLLAASKEYADAVIATAGAMEAYVWYADDAILESRTITPEQWHEARPLVGPLRESASKLDHLVLLIDDEEVKHLNQGFSDLARRILAAPDEEDGGLTAKQLWNEAVSKEQPDRIAALVEAAHTLRARQLTAYPTHAPGLVTGWWTRRKTARSGS
ncbi:Uncharacterised protein (plasmid) [Tsukamurella tyrosinosolvens]|uniref:Uncharacterized protein n=1 Tax=Tsukamurella tyrosinosolvens TaxID=57704 RepID=A0A1H4WMT6_TSUTY|nr:hypothetical protein [Tsukamurella tyrosinosolvens]KXO99665.1 hypothetical protein AXK58_00075 [Tsukamurella tyrosinosolvens]SEC94058.1 hypothetical protein SAMN04489793_3599 [Tsukamurella tyrosinosolvens]VEH89428.1 Uncharacterised protein [Tsukamurella tyrosinosolvens]